MPPHRALQVYDVLREIFQYITPTSGSYKDEELTRAKKANRRTLLSAARVCRGFLDPALDVLWNELDSVEPALNLLPSVEVAGSLLDIRVEDPTYYLHAIVTPQQWARFRYYANRVQKLFFFSGPSPASRDDVLMRLTQQNGDQPLFPALQRLHYVHCISQDTTILSFVSPSLYFLAIYHRRDELQDDRFRPEDRAFSSVLTAVLAKAPQLKTFHSRGIPHPTSLLAITACQHLRTIQIDPQFCDPGLLRQLSVLPSLRVLKIRLVCHGPNLVCPRGFPMLQHLTVSGPLPNIITFLPAVISTRIHTVHVVAEGHRGDFPDTWTACTTSIATQFPALRSLSLEDTCWVPDVQNALPGNLVAFGGNLGALAANLNALAGDNEPSDTFSTVVRPLMTLHGLYNVEFTFQRPLSPATDIFLEMGQNWRKLTSFRATYKLASGGTAMDPRFLIDFATLFPRLRELKLPSIDFKQLARFPPYALDAQNLRLLDVGSPKFATPEENESVARFIEHFFPNLDLKRSLEYEKRKHTNGGIWITKDQLDWQKVLELIGFLREQRKDEMDFDEDSSWYGDSMNVSLPVFG